MPILWYTLLRHNTENSQQMFPEKELYSHSPNFHIHVSVSILHIPTINLPILLQEIWGHILGLHKTLTDTWMWKLGLRLRNFHKGIHKWDFPCSAVHPLSSKIEMVAKKKDFLFFTDHSKQTVGQLIKYSNIVQERCPFLITSLFKEHIFVI
jgi:hypothetical protein